jgi:DnaJ-class molecular chaperone
MNGFPELEKKCEHCQGHGRVPGDYYNSACSKCWGAGYVPTEVGEAILALMRHHLQIERANENDG